MMQIKLVGKFNLISPEEIGGTKTDNQSGFDFRHRTPKEDNRNPKSRRHKISLSRYDKLF